MSTDAIPVFDTVYLSLGSNIGDRKFHIFRALAELSALLNCEEIEVSPLYETQAWGNIKQPDFLNCVAKFTFANSQQESLDGKARSNNHLDKLLMDIHFIEKLCGREHDATKWSARSIDIDILFYNDICYQSPTLTIPHPLIPERKFVLIPLNDIASDLQVPGSNISVKTMLENCADHSRVSLYQGKLKTESNNQQYGINV